MAWQDRLLPASFRGIPFRVEVHELKGGRRSINHEPLERDANFTEDLGGKAQGYFITAFILGDDYFFVRDALIDAMEQPEVGTLFHPYLGLKEVQPGQFTMRETINEGRICRLELSFTEAGDPSAVFEAVDKVTGFINAGVAAIAQIENAVDVAVSLAGLPAFAINSANSLINNFGAALINSVPAAKANLDELATITFQINFLDNNAETLLSGGKIQTGEKFGDLGEVEGVRGIAQIAGSILSKVNDVIEDDEQTDGGIDDTGDTDTLSDIFKQVIEDAEAQEREIDQQPDATSTRKQEKFNLKSLIAMLKRLAIVNLANRAANRQFFSQSDAIAEREFITNQITQQTELVLQDANGEDVYVDDEFFQSFKDLLAFTSEVVPDPTTALGQVKEIVIPLSLPALVVSYNEYGNVDRESDIITRNRIENPCFVVGDLEVVVNG